LRFEEVSYDAGSDLRPAVIWSASRHPLISLLVGDLSAIEPLTIWFRQQITRGDLGC